MSRGKLRDALLGRQTLSSAGMNAYLGGTRGRSKKIDQVYRPDNFYFSTICGLAIIIGVSSKTETFLSAKE